MRAAKRQRLRETPLAPERVAIITDRFPYFSRLSRDDRRELLGHVQVFLDEKNFEGCGGLELTDEIKLTIAAQACLLLLHRDTDYYPRLDAILVYPDAYRAPTRAPVGGGLAIETSQARLGESHQRGIVVLSWDAIAKKSADVGYREPGANHHNVVLHEFAHQLDQEDGAADGVPVLESRAAYAPWAHVLKAEFDALKKESAAGREGDIDSYGATNPAEFFAVVTEAFFEDPEKLAKNHARLYEQLSSYYKQDPLARLGITFEPPPPEPGANPPKSARRSDTTLRILRSEAAAKLVGVSDSFRESVVAIGCEPRGFLSAIHGDPGKSQWGFVAEVFACADPSVVAATYELRGMGVAFWTLLANGTIVDTETTPRVSKWIRFLLSLSLRKYTEHIVTKTWAEPPAALYARHLGRVRKIAGREKTVPVSRDPLTLYAACRLRSTDAADAFFADFLKRTPLGMLIVLVAVAAAMFSRATIIDRGTIGASITVGVFAATLLGWPVAFFIEQMRPCGRRVLPDALFAAAAKRVKEENDIAKIKAIVGKPK